MFFEIISRFWNINCTSTFGLKPMEKLYFLRTKPDGRMILTNPEVKDRNGPILINNVI